MAICKNCGASINWAQVDGKWVPKQPGTGQDHRNLCSARKPKALIVVDVETTGTDEAQHEIVQIAAVALHPQTLDVLSTFDSYLMPLFPDRYTPEAMATTGLTPEFLADQPHPDEVRERFMAWVGQYDKWPMPIGYNVDFDLRFIARWAPKIEFAYRKLDVMALAIALLFLTGQVTDVKLGTVCAYMGIPLKAHDALGDVTATAEVLRQIIGQWVDSGDNPYD